MRSKQNINVLPMLAALALTANIFLWQFQFPLFGFDGIGINFMLSAPLAFGFTMLPPVVKQRFGVLLGLLLLHALLVFLFGALSARAVGTIIAIGLFVSGICVALRLALRDNFLATRKLILLLLYAQLFLHSFEFAGLYDPSTNWSRPHYLFGFDVPTGFFTEASHVGLCLGPLMFLWFSPSALNKRIALLAGTSVMLSLSTTGVVVVVFISLAFLLRSSDVSTVMKRMILALSAGVVIYIVLTTESFTEINERVVSLANIITGEAGDNINLSSLIYMNGANMALEGLRDIVGAGAGQMLLYYPDAPYSFLIEVINRGEALNRNDGGSTAFKLFAEFGVFALVFVIYYVLFVVRLLRQEKDPLIIILSMYLLITMVRGASYFDDAVGISVGLLMFAPVLLSRARQGQVPSGAARWQSGEDAALDRLHPLGPNTASR